MIVGRTWTWGHISKTGGDATRAMVQALDVPCEVVTASDQAKHGPFGTQIDPGGDRVYATNIRRLPAWVISTLQHRSAFGWFEPEASPHRVTVDAAVSVPWADDWYRWLTRGGRAQITWWLRMEHLAQDLVAFLRVVERWSACETADASVRLEGFPHVNALDYDHGVSTWMTPEQIDRCYAMNPEWSANEAWVYGVRPAREAVAV